VSDIIAASICASLSLIVMVLALIQWALLRIGTALRDMNTTLTRKAASEALFRREQTYGALRDRMHKGDGRG
jgi:hypothetical protein